jgi:predicted transcriptional regulator
MNSSTDTFEYVFGSSARKEVLRALADATATRRDVVESCDSSESSVYDALNKLKRRGLVYQSGDDEWTTTGAGRIVADSLAQCGAIESVVREDREYWRTHDAAVVPDRFRRDIGALADHEVVRSSRTDPYRANRLVADAIRDADTVAVLAPIYNDRFAEALADTDATDKRLLMTTGMATDLAENDPRPPESSVDDVECRVAAFDVAMTVTDDEVLLSLPALDGTYDPETEIRATTDAATTWGDRLFDHLWRDATPIDEFRAGRDDAADVEAEP